MAHTNPVPRNLTDLLQVNAQYGAMLDIALGIDPTTIRQRLKGQFPNADPRSIGALVRRAQDEFSAVQAARSSTGFQKIQPAAGTANPFLQSGITYTLVVNVQGARGAIERRTVEVVSQTPLSKVQIYAAARDLAAQGQYSLRGNKGQYEQGLTVIGNPEFISIERGL